MMDTRRRWALAALAVAVIIAIWAVWFTAESTSQFSPTDSSSPDPGVHEVTRVVESLVPGSVAGFDPASWRNASTRDEVLSEGSTISVIEGTVLLSEEGATADVFVVEPGEQPQRHWVFLHQVEGEWLVYGTMRLSDAG